MKTGKEKDTLAISTEEKIKNAAREVFYKKGYAATRTRDIAEEAGINLALLNYYFRSKEKLFDIIMTEALAGFVQSIAVVLNDKESTLNEKVEILVTKYIDMIISEPEIPGFILGEIRNNPEGLLKKLPVKQVLYHSVFLKQHQQAVAEGHINEPNPLQFLMNLIGLVVFPFIAKPMLKAVGEIGDAQFNELMQRRKKLIPVWIKTAMEMA